jgi:hypothetical protein
MAALRRPYIGDPVIEAIAGLVLFGLGAVLLHDAYDARGRKLPWPLRPLSFW